MNSNIYQSLAHVYQHRWKSFLKHQRGVLKPLIDALPRTGRKRARILDIGCGVGLDMFLLHEAGFSVEGLDAATNMVSFAKKNVPHTRIRIGDIMRTKLPRRSYDAIVLDAFIHLFPKKDIPLLLKKVNGLLKPSGLIFISTTRSRCSREGMEVKHDYPGGLMRYRAHWTKSELFRFLRSQKLSVVSYAEDKDPKRPHTWMTVVVQR